MSKIARIYQGTNEIQKYYQGGVLQRLFFDWKHYIGNELNIEYGKECAGRNVVIKGKTYQNLFRAELNQGHANSSYSDTATYNTRINSVGFTLPIGTYTITISNKYELIIYKNYGSIENTYLGWLNKITWANNSQSNNIRIMVRKVDNSNITIDEVKGKIVLLEGDYTDIDIPTSIDGIESVAEREENLVNTATIYESMLESGVVDSLFNPKSSSTYDVYKMEIQPNTEYLFNLVGYGQAPWVRILDKNNIIVKSQNLSSSGLSYIWSLKTEDNFYYLVFNKPKTSTGTFQVYKKENPYPLKLAINEEINLINLPIPLRSLPDGVCDTIEGNRLIQRVGKITVNGSDNVELGVDAPPVSGFFTGTIAINNIKASSYLICDKFLYQRNNSECIFSSSFVNTGIRIRLSNDKATDVATFKTWLSENPVTVYYELATPTETEITPDMILINGEPITDTVGIELPNGIKDIMKKGIYTKNINKIVLDGSDDELWVETIWSVEWGKTHNGAKVYEYRNIRGTSYVISTNQNNFLYESTDTTLSPYYGTNSKELPENAFICKGACIDFGCHFDTVEDFRNFLAENPFTIQYELATPIKIPLFSIKEGLTTLKSTNNITPQNIELDCLVRDDFQNMCDNEWKSGDIAYRTGEDLNANMNRIRLINYIKVKPNTKYRMDILNSVKTLNKGYIGARYYDNEKSYLDMGGSIGTISKSSIVFTTPENCYYIRFIVETTDTNFKIYLKEVF